jgi:hypothetical protein
MLTCGGRICGNCAIGRPISAISPSNTVMIAITIATIGRLMKNADIARYPLLLSGAASGGGAGSGFT